MKNTVIAIARHDWTAFCRRNFAGLVAGLFPVLAAPLLAFFCSSVVQASQEIAAFGYALPADIILAAALTALASFPTIYATFLSSDTLVLERELGTIDLIWWSPIPESTYIFGKAILPFTYGTMIVTLNFGVFGGMYSLSNGLLSVQQNIWPTLLSMYLLTMTTVALGVTIGMLISSFAPSIQAAATTSLLLGSAMVVSEVGLGVVLWAYHLQLAAIELVLGSVTSAATILVAALVKHKLKNREDYILRK